jgi:hypothetical protein
MRFCSLSKSFGAVFQMRMRSAPTTAKSPLYSNGEILVAKEVSPAKTPENNWLQTRYSTPCAEYSCVLDSVG